MNAGPMNVPEYHRFVSPLGEHVLLLEDSSIFDLPTRLDDAELGSKLRELSPARARIANAEQIAAAARPRSISLNVSSGCNLSCSYCYASQGSFAGAQSQYMSEATARAAVDRLLESSDPSLPVTVGFMGGEPLLARRLIHATVTYARDRALRARRRVGFSITTNASLLEAEDIELFRSHAFAVTVSLDGGAGIQNRQRSLLRGDSFARVTERVRPLLADPGRARVAARVTVTRQEFELRQRFEAIRALGFRDIGFAPVRHSPTPGLALQAADWEAYRDELVGLAERELGRLLAGQEAFLSNLSIAMKELHRGACRPYACGAGHSYFSVAADSRWFACHRAVGVDRFRMGTSAGLDTEAQRRFLDERHVHAQDACQSCWARYLCSGGCHQEASLREQSSCGFIRSWLEFCLAAYCQLSRLRPAWFQAGEPAEVS